MTTFEQDLRSFRKHVRILRKLGVQHVSAKIGQREFHCEGIPHEEKAPAVGGGIGFGSGDEDD